MDTILQPLLDSPQLPQYLAEIQAILANEAQKRENFYNVINENDKAEFIHGQIIMHSPVKRIHNVVSSLLHQLLNIYVIKHQLGEMGFDKMMVHLSRNSYEPDVCFWLHEKSHTFTENQMLFPAPDFIVEVLSKSTEKIDRGIKMIDYAAHGVSEYWLIHPQKRFIEKYLLDGKKYWKEKTYSIEDEIQSTAIQGFIVPVIAIFDAGENLKQMQRILHNSEE
ncbi:MAG: Uma2 family endonuclease [Bacteroidia bacterium]